MNASGINLGAVPTWVLLLSLLWIMPALRHIGANPILSASLIGPLLPGLGVLPTAIANGMIQTQPYGLPGPGRCERRRRCRGR